MTNSVRGIRESEDAIDTVVRYTKKANGVGNRFKEREAKNKNPHLGVYPPTATSKSQCRHTH
ncbi:MAG: hypothetical protein F6K19_07540 [Cyanothece sp. SIO1E1]|nr:hypothetical protein [Cyanothece sp. SIO1E1]